MIKKSWLGVLVGIALSFHVSAQYNLKINEKEYLEMPGLNVMVFHDYYAEGHQTGVTIIQHGSRIAANGDLRIQAAPGQWDPVPKVGKRVINKENNAISVSLSFPDSSMINRRFNPIEYPELFLDYEVRVTGEKSAIKIQINLEDVIPDEWLGKIGFNLELFPGELFGHTYVMDGNPGIFPRQVNGPFKKNEKSGESYSLLAQGSKLLIAPEDESKKLIITSSQNELALIDGRSEHNNGWFIVRSVINTKKTGQVIEWEIKPHVIENWKYKPVIHISQLGYHPDEPKMAVVEFDKNETIVENIKLFKYSDDGEKKLIAETASKEWGVFQRYKYVTHDFSHVNEPGVYELQYGSNTCEQFTIKEDIYQNHVWQPTLEYFLPVQMCHMRVTDRYRVWHGACHLDDALMAPTDTVYIDGYHQDSSTYTRFNPFEHVPGLNRGGWHDAGDFDLRVESQAGTVKTLGLMVEEFDVKYDQTTVDQHMKEVRLHEPDGASDALQQIEHGVIGIIAGYQGLGRLYRGIISPTKQQYVHLGDPVTMSDQLPCAKIGEEAFKKPCDDRWVFTEKNPRKEISVAGCLAIAGRLLKGFNDTLSLQSIEIAEEIFINTKVWEQHPGTSIETLTELYLATNKAGYLDKIEQLLQKKERYSDVLWTVARILPDLKNETLKQQINDSALMYINSLDASINENPFGVPYRPHIWGAAWGMQQFAMKQYFIHKTWPNEFSQEILFNTLHFILGCHPGKNPISFVSGVGKKSATTAYGFNRADWSYIPGGVISGTAYIRPDLPELKTWPYFWQQTEYVIGGGASNFMFLVLSVNKMLE